MACHPGGVGLSRQVRSDDGLDACVGLPIRIVHGTQDWMFPPEMAQGAERALRQTGADVSYREITDLSHTYPRDENAAILDWFMLA